MAEKKISEVPLKDVYSHVWNREVGVLHEQKSVAAVLKNTSNFDSSVEGHGRLVGHLTALQEDGQVLKYMRRLLDAFSSVEGDGRAIITLPSGKTLDLRSALGQSTTIGFGSDRPTEAQRDELIRRRMRGSD